MASLTLKNIPEVLLESLRARAAENRRSLNSEILVLLEESVLPETLDAAVLLARIDALHAQMPAAAPLTDEEITRMKHDGRP